MRFLRGNHIWFWVLTLVTLMAFLLLRPLNSPTQRIIAADGLGYYAYLPAKFIYNDNTLSFNWFDKVFDSEYDNFLFEKPSDNFMVAYHNKKINKYYPGQSLLQLPFFLIAHGISNISGYPANGFSLPYQLAMGIAALFYTLMGLLFCRKLLSAHTQNGRVSTITTFLIFFGTNLFTYTVFNGCYSHCYSFCMITLVYYAAFRFFSRRGSQLTAFLFTVLFSVIAVSIRPLNLLLLPGVFYFYKPFDIRNVWSVKKRWPDLFLVLSTIGILAYNLKIIYTQTGALVINSYTGEKFYFSEWQHVADNLVGFQYGMLWYTPVILLCFIAVIFLAKKPAILWLLLPLLSVIALYSLWWYWNIVSRVIVDATVIMAILLVEIFIFFGKRRNSGRYLTALALLCISVFQLKAYQLRAGILDSNYTYAKYYFKHFITLSKVYVFPVNPRTVIAQEDYFQDFETQQGNHISLIEKHAGNRSALLNAENEYACTSMYKIPVFFADNGFKKIRAAFWMRASKQINNIHLVFKFSRNDSTLVYLPFYIKDAGNKTDWDFKEFGTDLPAGVKAGDGFSVYFWNPDHQNEAFIDNLKIEFFLTNGADEVTVR